MISQVFAIAASANNTTLAQDYDALTEEYGLTYLGIVDRVYKQPFPNRWLAQFTKFMSARREHPYIHNLLVEAFKAFFERNIKQYDEWKALEVTAKCPYTTVLP